MFGIAAILGRDAVGHTPCGCGECDQKLEIDIRLGQPLKSEWIVHFMVPAVRFWENIGFT